MNRDKLQFLSPLFLKYQNDFEKNPRSRVFAPLAEAYRKVGMLDKAMDILSQGLRYNSSYVMGHLGLAFCYFDLGQFHLTYSTLRPFVETNRDNLRLQKLFAETCLQLDKKDEALETLKYLLFINPKDKDVALLVQKTEKEVEEKHQVIHRPIHVPVDEKNAPLLFEVEKLQTMPVVDFDDWLKIDFNSKVEKIPENKIEEWSVNKQLIVEEEKVVTKPIVPDRGTPFVTHTLVDLYCGQGHIEKALEILEKILMLNPNDEKTIDKIKELKSVMSIESIEDVVVESTEEDGHRHLMSILEEKIFVEDNRSLVEDKLNIFLKKIHQRAQEYRERS